jgi:hypothetical protein
MGKREKEHRKKVAARNQKVKTQQNAMQKLFNESMRKQLEELKKERELVNPNGTSGLGDTQITL